jgi:SAM-dependent methyltransferase
MTESQSTIWNGAAGHAWVESQEMFDRLFGPIDVAIAASVSDSGKSVLDVGCGTGSTTVAVARKLGADARHTGIDISEPMIAAARGRVAREGIAATFIVADAQDYAFAPASFDAMVSRFGVMFFEDFTCAFANLRRAASSSAELHFVAWRSADENPFMTTAERAAAPLLPNLPPRDFDAPGQFAFADQRRVQRILEQGGWQGIDIRPLDVECVLLEKDLDHYLTRFGPVGQSLQDADEQTRSRVRAVVRSAFQPFVHGDEVRFVAACWMIEAHA